MFKTIVENLQGKNILVIGSPRSGTHPLADQFTNYGMTSLGEICTGGDRPWEDIIRIYQHNDQTCVAQLTSKIAKIFLSGQINDIKQHVVIVAIRRHDKIKQFASWIYFRNIGSIYNFDHAGQDWQEKNSITATFMDLEEFMSDQMLDSFFKPDYIIDYEDVKFDNRRFVKNQYVYPLEEIFTNLDFVKTHLTDWSYND